MARTPILHTLLIVALVSVIVLAALLIIAPWERSVSEAVSVHAAEPLDCNDLTGFEVANPTPSGNTGAFRNIYGPYFPGTKIRVTSSVAQTATVSAYFMA